MAAVPEINSVLLDTEQVSMLIETGGEAAAALLGELLELYQSECLLKFEELRSSVQTENITLMGKAAHAIAGSSANIGARAMWHLSKKLEEAANRKDMDLAMSELEQLEQHYEMTIAALESIISKL